MSDNINALLFFRAVIAVIARFFTTVTSVVIKMILGILARAILPAVLLVSVLSLIAVFVMIPIALAVLVALAVSVDFVTIAAM